MTEDAGVRNEAFAESAHDSLIAKSFRIIKRNYGFLLMSLIILISTSLEQ